VSEKISEHLIICSKPYRELAWRHSVYRGAMKLLIEEIREEITKGSKYDGFKKIRQYYLRRLEEAVEGAEAQEAPPFD